MLWVVIAVDLIRSQMAYFSHMSKKEAKKIPLEKVPEGVEKCKNVTIKRLDSAELLIDNPDCVNDAGLLVIHALEEYGKAMILERKSKEAKIRGEPFILINGRSDPFYDHQQKIGAALGALPPETGRLTMGTFDPTQTFFKTGEKEISQDLKESVTYADFNDGNWVTPHTFNPAQLKKLIGEIRSHVVI